MKRRSGFQIMKRLIVELKPLAPIMAITISMGVVGFLAAIAIASFGAIAIGAAIGDITFISFTGAMVVMAVSALLRGFLRYGEQLSGHYIAFKILYILRDKIFAKLRKLAPAKLEGQEKGNLISLITSDIELLEVFYAHTIAPITIAIITNSIISIILFMINTWFGILSVIFFLIVGFVIPYASSSLGKEAGVAYRNMFGECNNYILDSLRGLKEVLLFKSGDERLKEINSKSYRINKSLDKIKEHEGIIRAVTDLTIMIAILTFVGVGFAQYSKGNISFTWMLVGIVIIASSFGPVVALSNLSNTLLQTFACAERLFDLIDEEPHVEEVLEGQTIRGESIAYDNVTFSYPNRKEKIFDTASVNIKKGDKIALIGESGIGKTSLAKELSRINNYHLVTIDGNLLKEGEIGGLPIVEKKEILFKGDVVKKSVTKYATHVKLMEIDDHIEKGEKVLLFIDELNRCEHAVQQELMNLILNREINGYKLNEDVYILAAMNPSNKYDNYEDSDYQVIEMDPAQEDRFVWIDISSNLKEWMSWAMGDGNIHEHIIEFLSTFPEYFHTPNSLETIKATPRSWERVSKAYRVYLSNKKNFSKEILYNALKGNVGSTIAQEFIAYISNLNKPIISNEEIFESDVLGFNIRERIMSENHSRMYIIAKSALYYLEGLKDYNKELEVFSDLLSCYPKDLRLGIMKEIKSDHSEELYRNLLNEDKFLEAFFDIYS